jgi:hypothetical protein
METISAIILAVFLGAMTYPLIRLLSASIKENKRLSETHQSKKNS